MTNRRPIPDRRGVFLVEVVAVIGLSAIILGMTVALMALLLRLHHARSNDLVEMHALLRLSEAFRKDVRASSTAEPVPPATPWEESKHITLSQSTGDAISYELHPDGITRNVSRAGARVATELYRLGDVRAHFSSRSLDSPGNARLIGLELHSIAPTPSTRQSPNPRPAYLIEAVLDRDNRFASTSKDSTP